MKKALLVIIVAVVTVLSCNNSTNQQKQQPAETPKALQDNQSSTLISKRGPEDLVGSLYLEELEKSSELRELEAAINKLRESKRDSAEAFHNYDNKNLSYYQSAEGYIGRISDSLLRTKIKSRIAASAERYNVGTKDFKNLLQEMDTKSIALSDWHSTLKLAVTLPLIEKYQSDSKPSSRPIQHYLKEQEKTINKLKTLVKE
jgi:hypothetical protein